MLIRKQTPLARAAFTLMEMLVVVAIIVVLAGIGGAILLPQLDKAKEDADRAQAHTVADACNTFKINNERFPTTVDELTNPDANNNKPLLSKDAVLDRNKQPFQISEAQSGEVIVSSQQPGKDGSRIGNWKKGSQPPQ